jgi:trehalose 6-phosphate phosphatase
MSLNEDLPDRAAPAGLPDGADWQECAAFFDFDGTLAPIRNRPQDVRLAPRERALIATLLDRTGGAVAVISGRALADLDAMTDGLGVVLSGSHGVEVQWPGRDAAPLPDAAAHLDPAREALAEFAGRHDLLSEHKPGAVTIHYRGRPDLAEACRDLACRLAGADETLRAIHGHMVCEVALRGVDKGTALTDLLGQAPFEGRRPVFAGDDSTDEDAIRAAQAMGGVGIRIGDAESAAAVRFDTREAFVTWLDTSLAPD